MAEISFVERMRYLLSQLSEKEEKLDSAMIERVAAILDEFESTLGDELHRIRMLEDKSEARSWMWDVEVVAYEMEDAVEKWRVNSLGRFSLLAQCFLPAYASRGSIVIAMESHVETLLFKGEKLVAKTKLKNNPDHLDQQILLPSVREDDKIRVLENLLSPDDSETGRVVSIVGFGGSGKTTLARSLFNHDSVKAYFQVRVWVHVEADISDDRKMAIKLLNSLRVPVSEDELQLSESVLMIQTLCDSFSGKTVLAVFDDVWAGSKSWDPFINKLFENSKAGSRILVTTRACDAAGIVHTLAPLSVRECSSIVNNYAIELVADILGNLSNLRFLSSFTEKLLAEKCEGSPLVAKILGIKLRSNQYWDLYEHMEEVCMVRFPHLYDTYEKLLPAHMKACLLFCASFPKSTVLRSEKIIRLWMSQGYLGYHNCSFKPVPYPDVERKGIECLRRLIQLSFLQRIDGSLSIHKTSSDISLMCELPDDVHDFITYMARAHDFITYMARAHGNDFVAYMAKAHDNGRRSFIGSPEIPLDPGLFRQKKCITALILSSCQLEQLPDEVRLLSRLQYLDLSDNPLKQLPPTICELYYLEFLDVHCCYTLYCLPEKIEMLKQMRHLRMKHTTEELHDLPSGFDKLTLMRTIDVFRVGGKYKDAINKLSNLNHLVDICIAVHGEVHLPAAKLDCKDDMVNLELIFVGEGRNPEIASSSIDVLKPPPNLEMLKFEQYPGLKLPSWILAESIINKLKRLSLRSAANLSSLPALWKLSSLEFLWLQDIPNLKHLGCDFFGLTNTPQQQLSLEASRQHMNEDDGEITAEITLQDAEREEEEITADGEITAEEDAEREEEEITADGEITAEEDAEREEEEITADGEITAENPAQDAEREGAAFRSLKTLRIEYLENWETWEDSNEANEFNIKVMPCLEELIIAHCPKLQGRSWPFASLPLRILKHTPWFEKMGETHENNMKQPSDHQADNKNEGANVALEASYVKLKNFVHEAYMTKAQAQPLKVSIPEGVLGKTMVTSYLPIDSLHVWFEEDRSIFAEQMCVWSKHIYELMTPFDKERVQMASSALIKTVGRQEHPSRRADNLVNFMMANKAKLYLVPFLRPGHWELLAVVPETKVIYWFDSLQENISLELTEFLNMVERKYVSRSPNSTVAHNSWKVVDIKHKRQVDNWECGYYVMIWMHKIALEIQDLNLESHFPVDTSSYEPDKLTEVDWKWCAHVMPEFVA